MGKFKFKLKAFAASVAALIAASSCVVAPVFANSGIRYEYGVTGAGVHIRNEKSALAVESEKLTFDIPDFPQVEGFVEEEYKSTVTAEYKFVNTSENTVHTSMAFPMGNIESYYEFTYPTPAPGSTSDTDYFAPTITVNGAEVPTQVRHTYGSYYYFADSVSKLSDEWYEDDFYKLDTPVTAYTVKVDRGRYSDIVAAGKPSGDRNKVRILSPNGYYDEMNYYYYETSSTFEDLVERGQYVFYVLGDKSELKIDWTVQREQFRYGIFGGKIERHDVDLPVEVNEITDKDGQPVYPTLKDFILSFKPSNGCMTDMDYYNAVMQNNISNDKEYLFAGDFRNFPTSYSQFCIWYTYDVEVEPGGSIVNVVKAPLYPDVGVYYEPPLYSYEYYLSPAAGWADFGTLEININTPYYAIGIGDKFTKTESGYSATFSELPSGELRFRLCTEENPTYVGRHPGTAIPWEIVIFIFILLLAFALKFILTAVVIPIVLVVNSKAK